MKKLLFLALLLIPALLVPLYSVGAHEVYVLSSETIARDLATPSPNPFESYASNQFQFFFWGFIVFVGITTVFFASITHRLELFFSPFLGRLRTWAPLVARITLGTCLIASAYNNALFGPELPLADFGVWAGAAQLLLYVSGALVLFGLYTRIAAALGAVVFVVGVAAHGSYMLNYTNYAGEMLVVFLLGAGGFSIDAYIRKEKTVRMRRLFEKFEPYAFLLLRIAFGISIIFAAVYAKFIHSNLALSTISQYHLTNFFHFDPLFIVLGACIIEVLMGVFFIIGFEIRHTALFFLFWIGLSLLYFGESVWPHLVLVGINTSLFMYGYDRLTVEGRLFNRGALQPFL